MDKPHVRFGIRLSEGRGVTGFREPLNIPLGMGSNVVGDSEIRLGDHCIAICPIAADSELLGWHMRMGAEMVVADFRKVGIENIEIVELPPIEPKSRARRRKAA